MEACVFETERHAARAVAAEIATLLRANGPDGAVIGLCAGRSPATVYEELVRLHRAGELSFAQATFFGLDELAGLAEGAPATFRAFLERALLGRIDVARERVHLLPSSPADPAAACAAFERAIRDAGGIDLCLCGIGANGHVAFNEPGSDAATRTRLVDLDASTRRAQAARGADVRQALTMGVATILEARALRVLAFGADKAAVARECLQGEPRPEMPITLLRDHPDARLILDEAAAAEIGEEE